MYKRAEKPKENNSKSVSDTVTQEKSANGSTFQFVDNRPESITQRQIKELANNPQVKQAAQLRAIVYNHASQQQQSIQKKEINTSPDIAQMKYVHRGMFADGEKPKLGHAAKHLGVRPHDVGNKENMDHLEDGQGVSVGTNRAPARIFSKAYDGGTDNITDTKDPKFLWDFGVDDSQLPDTLNLAERGDPHYQIESKHPKDTTLIDYKLEIQGTQSKWDKIPPP